MTSESTDATTPVRRFRRRSFAAPAAALLAAAALAGCGGGAKDGDANADPAKVVPEGSAGYVSFNVRPKGELKANAERMARTLFGTDDPGGEIVKLLEELADGPSDLSFKEDIDPWLGDHVAMAITSVRGRNADVLVVAASRDNDRAREALEKSADLPESSTYQDVELRASRDGSQAGAVLGDTVVFGSDRVVRQAIAATKSGAVLAESAPFQEASRQVPANGIASGYLDAAKLVGAVASASGQGDAELLETLIGGQVGGIAATLNVNEDNLRLQAVVTGLGEPGEPRAGGGTAAGALAQLPGDAWLGLGIGDVDGTVAGILRRIQERGGLAVIGVAAVLAQFKEATGLDVEQDILAWMGEGGIFVQGTSEGGVGGGLIVRSKDPAATRRAVKGLAKGLPRLVDGSKVTTLTAEGVNEGFKLTGSSLTFYVASAGERFIVAIGERAFRSALKPGSPLTDSPGYKSIAPKLGSQLEPAFYLDLQSVADLIESHGAKGGAALAVLRKFTQVVAGGRRQGDALLITLVAGVKTG